MMLRIVTLREEELDLFLKKKIVVSSVFFIKTFISMSIKILSLLLSIIVLVSCASQPERLYTTVSGKPEVTINAPIEDVKGAVIQRMAINSWTVKSDSDYQTSFTKPCTSGGSLMACATSQALLGNAYSTTPDFDATILWLKTPDGIKVMLSSYNLSTQMAFGQVNRASLLGNNNLYNHQSS